MDIQKQIEYWIKTAEDDLVTAKLLVQNERFLHGLFFCHLNYAQTPSVSEVNDYLKRTINLFTWLKSKL